MCLGVNTQCPGFATVTFISHTFMLHTKHQVEMKSTKAPLQGLGLSTLFLPLLGPVFYLMLLAGQASCAALVPACVKLKVSVWMVKQLFSLYQRSQGRGPINLEGTLSPGSRKGHSPQGEEVERLSLIKSSQLRVFFFLLKFLNVSFIPRSAGWLA